MSTAVWYPSNRSDEAEPDRRITNDARLILITQGAKPKRSTSTPAKVKRIKQMSPASNGTDKLKIQKTVFDLTSFDNITLFKEIEPPAKPASVSEALAVVGNDEKALIELIYQGLIARARENASEDLSGFVVVDEETGTEKPYDGKFADESLLPKINAAVLSLAKLRGFEKSLTPEKKKALKEEAREFLRKNPAMLTFA